MKKAAIMIMLLPLLTGCWDQLQLSRLRLVDIAGFDLNEESEDVEIQFIVTKLKSAGQGTGEPNSVLTKLKGPSLTEAFGQGEYIDKGPFLGISTRVYLLSQRFASHEPVSELAFLLETPYSSISSPVVVLEGNMHKVLENQMETNKEFTKDLNEFIMSLEKNKFMPTVSMMNFIQSRDDPLEDLALPVLGDVNTGVGVNGALLFRHGTITGVKLDKEQVRMMMLLLKKELGRQRFTGNLSENSGEQPSSDKTKQIHYGFSVKKKNSKITISHDSSRLPKVNIQVQLKIIVFELGHGVQKLKPDYVNRMEKELSNHMENMAVATIETMQKANCDVLGIGKQLKAYHPNIWKSLKWRKDYPRVTIEPNFDVQILNSDAE